MTDLEITAFPLIQFFLQVTDANGKIVSDLQPDELEIMEDGYVRPISELARVQPGLQVLLAVNESPVLTNQVNGVSYYRIFHQTLDTWAAALPSNASDNYSYITNAGIQINQMTDTAGFAQLMAAYEPDLVNAKPGLTSLTMALDMTTDPLPNPYMKRAILYITPMLDSTQRASLPDIAQRAAQLGTRVFIWLVAPDYTLESAEVEPLRQLADTSGGEIFLYNGSEDFPNPESHLDPLRNIYQVSYQSAATTSGDHIIITRLTRPELQITAEQMAFNLQLAAPNPIFLDPPVQIERVLAGTEEETILEPLQTTLRILVEFPDGYPRKLKSSRLYVDDILAVENLTEPFDQFTVPLVMYEQDTQIQLRVEVTDELGLTSSSIDIKVPVIVEQPEPGLVQRIFTGRGLSILIAVSMAALVLGLVIYFTSQSAIKKNRPKKIPGKKTDPLTQPVPARTDRQKPVRPVVNNPTVRKQAEPVNAPARLVRLSSDGNPIPERMIPIIRRETSLGSDPQTATCILDNPSVSARHARIYQNSEGKFFVADTGSVAGTWVNFDLVNGDGFKLTHCDIIHFGLMAFRFEMSDPDCERIPVIHPRSARKADPS